MTRPTRARVHLVDGRARFTDLGVGTYLRPRPMDVDGASARLALVGTYATLLAGDDLRIDLEVGPGVYLEVIEPSGTVAYHVQGGVAHWRADVTVGPGARLVWPASPFVITAGANLVRHTHVELAAGARALLRETLMFGRTYEATGGPLRSTTHVNHDGHALLVEDLDLRAAPDRELPGIMGPNRAMASVLLLGSRPDRVTGGHETRFAGPGAMARALAPHAHTAEEAVAGSWDRWHEEFLAPESPASPKSSASSPSSASSESSGSSGSPASSASSESSGSSGSSASSGSSPIPDPAPALAAD
ncbi:urease accessory protein UreD [Pseudactinotalea sp. HY158]|uniref:urease accessory protein UreD n=1 Tax=Pseudactinotalea sp. HY158 TaxID=2654547 RepID=UPI001892648B|nr:urease accessory protein UreD [Pseudactinotalea sp. HY158]